MKWGTVLEVADVPPTMIVGVHGLTEEMPRLHASTHLVFDAERFAAHERFFVDDVRRWTQAQFGVALPAGRTAVFGYSAGAESLALALGLRHPDVYGVVVAGSPGGGQLPTTARDAEVPAPGLPSAERSSRSSSTTLLRWDAALRAAGADVAMNTARAGARCQAVAGGVLPAHGRSGRLDVEKPGSVRAPRGHVRDDA